MIKVNLTTTLLLLTLSLYGNLIDYKNDTVYIGVCNVETLNIRDTTDKNSDKIAQLIKNQKVLILEKPSSDWVKISVLGKTGYAYSKFLDVSYEVKVIKKINFLPELIVNGKLLNGYFIPHFYYQGWVGTFGAELFDEMFKFSTPLFIQDDSLFIASILGFFIFIFLFNTFKNTNVDANKSQIHKIEIAFPLYSSLFVGLLALLVPDIELSIILVGLSLLAYILIDFYKCRNLKRPVLGFIKSFMISILFLITGYYFMSICVVLLLLLIKIIIVVIAIILIWILISSIKVKIKDEETGITY